MELNLKSFNEETPQPGRTFIAVWAGDELEPEIHGGQLPGERWGYGALFSFGREPFGLKLFRGDCRGEQEATRAEAEEIADGKWAYLSDLIYSLANKDYPIQVEGGIDETCPVIQQLQPNL